MGAYNPSMKYGITLGSGKQPAYLMLAEYLKGFKVTKSELMSIFTNENDRKTAEQLFDLWNKTKNNDGNEEYIDCRELEEIGFQVLGYADNEEVEDDSPTNLSDNEVQQLYEKKGISGASSVLFKMVQYLSTKDIATAVESGDFKIDGQTINLHAMKMKGIDPNGKTYKLTTNQDFADKIMGKQNGQEEYIASFYAKNPELKTLTSRIYAAFFGDETFVQKRITAPNGVVGTVSKYIPDGHKFDADKKLALDILLGNNAPAGSISFDNAFDTNSDGIKKSFTIIPNEIEDIIKNNNYSRKDLINALKIIAELSDEKIEEMLDTDDAKNQYKRVLIKRRDFCRELLYALKDEPKSKSLPEQFESAKINVLEKTLSQISDIRDINAYEREIRDISDNFAKERLTCLLAEKKRELTYYSVYHPIESINAEEFEDIISKFGFMTECSAEPDGKRYMNLTEESIKKYSEKHPQLKISDLEKLDFNYLFDCVNLRRRDGIDVLKDEETFIKFILTERNLTQFANAPKKYDYETYMTILAAHDIPVNNKNYNGIKTYKDDNSYKYFHEMYKANSDTGMQVIEGMSDKFGIDGLSQFLNMASLPFDTRVYRGQELNMMENILLPDGSNLAQRMQDAVKHLPDETEINRVTEEFKGLNSCRITEPKFISTSLDPNIANEFARKKHGIRMNITLPAGSRAACLDALVMNRYKHCEEEILVQRGSDYIITGLRYSTELEVWIVDCKVETK